MSHKAFSSLEQLRLVVKLETFNITVIFLHKGYLSKRSKWCIESGEVKMVKMYKYLGVIFFHTFPYSHVDDVAPCARKGFYWRSVDVVVTGCVVTVNICSNYGMHKYYLC